MVSAIFPRVLLLDTILFAAFRMYIPMWLGYTIVCDRFIYDILVDTMYAIDDNKFHQKKFGRLFLSMIPRKTTSVLLDVDEEIIKERRPDLAGDFTLPHRKDLYLTLAGDLAIPIVTPDGTVEATQRNLLSFLEK